jgi:SAM-dependent methyltransferase
VNPTIFLLKSAYSHARGALSTLLRKGTVRRGERTIEFVRDKYDAGRAKMEIRDFRSFVIGDFPKEVIQFDGKLIFDEPARAIDVRMAKLRELVGKYARDGAIVELGSGAGRNLIYLAAEGIKNPMVGLELSSTSVDLAQRAAQTFGADIRFDVCDVTGPLPALGPVDVVLSVHAFEMMPRVFEKALENIHQLNPRAAIFFEPIEELWPWSLRGLIARLRVRQLDRLSGFYRPARRLGNVVDAREFGFATNALNTTALMVVEFPRAQ